MISCSSQWLISRVKAYAKYEVDLSSQGGLHNNDIGTTHMFRSCTDIINPYNVPQGSTQGQSESATNTLFYVVL